MQHPDEGTIHAWIDGALTVEEAASIESHAAECSECSAAIAEARGLIAASSRILLALDDVPGGVIPVPATLPRPRAWYARNDLRAAAAVLLVAGTSFIVVRNEQGELPPNRGTMSVSVDTARSNAAANAAAHSATSAATTAPAESSPASGTESAAPALADAALRVTRTTVPVAPNARMSDARGAAATRMDAKRLEADFSGKGVAGGTAEGVHRAEAQRTDAPRPHELRITTGVAGERVAAEAATTGAADGASSSALRLLRADSARKVKTIVYEVAKGREVTLIETEPEDFSQKPMLRGRVGGVTTAPPSQPLAAAQTSPASTAASTPASRATSPAPAPVAPQTVVRAAQINSISWKDTTTGRDYTLSGAFTLEELLALKSRIIAQRRSKQD